MPVSNEAVAFKLRWNKREEDAVLTVVCANERGHGHPGWKAVVKVADKRYWGAYRLSVVEAVDVMVQRHIRKISQSEVERIGKLCVAMQARRTGAMVSCGYVCSGYQPNAINCYQPSVATTNSQAAAARNGVYYVHQIYGLFGDNKPMSTLFQKSKSMWSDVAKGMGAEHHLWNAEELESLVKQKYPQFWNMYCDVRYPIMRADIGRIVIIHAYGGLYADLDVLPNRTWYEQVQLAIPRVRDMKKELISSKKKKGRTLPRQVEKIYYLEMEVIVGAQGNRIFLDWLEYIRLQLLKKTYQDKKSFWFTAKMRYVYGTTGPMSMTKFLRLPINAAKFKAIKYLECNYFKDAESLSPMQQRFFDVISYESNSYFTSEHDILVPVGPGDAQLPPVPTAKRMRVKSAAPSMGVTKNASSPEKRDHVDEVVHVQIGAVDMGESVEAGVVERECHQDRQHALELKAHLFSHRNMTGTQTLVEDMPEKLRTWLTSDWNPHHKRWLPAQPKARSSTQQPMAARLT